MGGVIEKARNRKLEIEARIQGVMCEEEERGESEVEKKGDGG